MASDGAPDGATGSACPVCGAAGRAVTAVTITTLKVSPRRVLVTRQCTRADCLWKYPVVKAENDLTEDEVRCWHRR